MDQEAQYRQETAKAKRAATAKKFMQEYFDSESERLYAEFVNSDPFDTDHMQSMVLMHRMLLAPQQWLQSIIDTGKLAQAELDKLN